MLTIWEFLSKCLDLEELPTCCCDKILDNSNWWGDASSWFIAGESFRPSQGSQAWQSSLIHGRSSISDSCWHPAAPKRRERHEPGGIDIKNLSTVTDLHHIISFSLKPCHQLENKYYKHESMEHIQVQSVAFCAWPLTASTPQSLIRQNSVF